MSPEPKTISVGRLRQNPTAMIREVRAGAEYVLTDRGVPAARIVPYTPHRWVSADDARVLLSVPSSPGWVAEIAAHREGDFPRDPWAAR